MSPMEEEEIESWVIIAGLIVVIIIIAGWIFATSNRPLAKYVEETRRQTFETSRTYIDGKNKTINDYCMNMQTANDTVQRKAMARWIKSEADNLTGKLTPAAQSCVAQANNVLEN